ncbi:MAG TPA: hypothetical protein VM820_03350 [Vicinamibacterales bacterium]|nr:hypothetical protein [Vicinamibacterales bacterium]
MSDTKESMPAQPPAKATVRDLEIPPAWAIAMSEKMESGFRGLRADVSMVANDVGLLRDRVVVLERAKLESDERASKNSHRVQLTSENDMAQDAKIATLFTDVAGLKTDMAAVKENQVTAAQERAETAAMVKEIKDSVTGFFKNPKVKFVGQLLFVLATGYAAARGIKVLP